jgi:hypothetical protein
MKDFTIQASVHVEVDNDVKGALTRLKPEVAHNVGGMGHRTKNFHNDIMVRRGFGDAAKRIQELYLAGHKDEAIASVPDEWVDLKSLVGPPAPYPRTLPRLGGQRRGFAQRAIAPARGHRGDGQGRAAELRS